mgnify:CR=1 FL=1
MPRPYFKEPNKIQEMIQVNHAGEFGAQQIYKAQIKFARSKATKMILDEMLQQELAHLEYFTNEIKSGRGRPTMLLPIWRIFGYGLGAVTGIMGHKYVMLATESVEEVIVNHYQDQINYLKAHDPSNPMLAKIQQFQQDEAAHIKIAIDSEYDSSFSLRIMKQMVKVICHSAIYLSKKV